MKIARLGSLLICIGVVIAMAGCKGRDVDTNRFDSKVYDNKVTPTTTKNNTVTPEPEPVCGGKTDLTDYDAPKSVQSEELISFTTRFYRQMDFVYRNDRSYSFSMKKLDDGTYQIGEEESELSCVTDADFAARLEKLIRDNDIAKLNGIYTETAGLPFEYAPESLNAVYASGESINYHFDGNPESSWNGMVLDLFAKEFDSHGLNELMPPKEDSVMTRFNIEYTFGDIRYLYGEIDVPVTQEEKSRSLEDLATNGFDESAYVTMAFASPWDRTGKTDFGEDRMAEITPEFYEALQAIVVDTDLVKLQNGMIFPGGFDYQNTPQYYEFFIEYESGKSMSGFSAEPADCEKFRPIAEKFAQFYENYLTNN